MHSKSKPVTFAMDQPLTVELHDNPAVLCKNAPLSPLLRFKTDRTTSRFFDRSADSAFSSQYDTSPHSSSGSSNPSEQTSASCYSPIIIGDRVYVGPSRITGTVAYMGPTHFAAGDMIGVVLDHPKGKHDGTAYGIRYFQCPPRCGLFCRLDNLKPMDSSRHSPNCRIRTESTSSPVNFHTNGLDYRRVSLTNQGPLTRSSSARFTRRHPQIASVIGIIDTNSKPTNHYFDGSSLQRSKSDRFKSSRPNWVPPGSPTARTNNQRHKPFVRSQTLPRPEKQNKRLVVFDLNASHDLNETTSVISCPSLRSSLKNSPRVIKSRSTSNLSICDRRSLHRSSTKTTDIIQKHSSRSLTWSPETTLRSKSADLPTRLSTKSFPTTSQPPVRRPQFNLTRQPEYQELTSEPVQNILHSFIPKSMSADIVIECAQDRLVELQNQVIEAYRARSEVAHALEEQRRRYKELVEVYEDFKSGKTSFKKTQSLPSSTQLDAMHLQLTNEYERTKGLLLELKQLSLQVNQSDVRRPVTPMRLCAENSNDKHQLAAIEESEAEPFSEANSSTHINVTVTSPDDIDCQIEKLRVVSAHQRQCDKLLCKMVVCRQVVREKLNEVEQQQSRSESEQHETPNDQPNTDISHRVAILEEVLKAQAGQVERENGRTRQFAVELSILQAEISHLSSGPIAKARDDLSRLQHAKVGLARAVNSIHEIHEGNMAIKETLESAKSRMEEENQSQMDYLRTNLRIHQLKQMKYKAKALGNEQHLLIRDKSRELTKVVDEFNLVSQAWASERELKLYANQQLKERLLALTGGDTVQSQQAASLQKAPSFSPSGYHLNQSNSSLTVASLDESPLGYSLFGALCKEIRRLQTRSASLVDALNTLNSGQCDETQLTQIKSLIHRPAATNSSKSSAVRERREKGGFKKGIAPRAALNDKPHSARSTSNLPTSTGSNSAELTVHSQTTNSTHTPLETESNLPLNADLSCPVQYSMTKVRRRRPVSFYLKRTFEPVLKDVIPEADEEIAESP